MDNVAQIAPANERISWRSRLAPLPAGAAVARLSHPTGASEAAEGASASPWWARASAVLERIAPWLFEKIPDDELRVRMVERRSPRPQQHARTVGTGSLRGRVLSEAPRQIRSDERRWVWIRRKPACPCGRCECEQCWDTTCQTHRRRREFDPCVTATLSIFPRR